MDQDNIERSSKLIGSSYTAQGNQSLRSLEGLVREIIEQRRLSERGYNELQIQAILSQLALMDSNNFTSNVGLGEREARVASSLVSSRHFGLCHGIGRSGEISAVQPKAAGSSIIVKLCNFLILDALHIAGAHKQAASSCVLIPMATGMALVMVFLTLRSTRPPTAKYILWPRIDQKSCFKSILTAGFVPVIVPNLIEGDELRTNIPWIENFIQENGSDSILCIFTTTSCFAPRTPDKLPEIAKICSANNIPHIINNAYGIQSSKCMHLISEAYRVGRVDAFVQSTDKNFLVPVGGAIVAGPKKEFIESISKMYPGRASNSPTLDIFITLLTLGANGFKELLKNRKENYVYLKEKLQHLATQYNTRVLETPHNDISMGLSLEPFYDESNPTDITFIGSMLFSRLVSGCRVVPTNNKEVISGFEFQGFMSHTDKYSYPYLTCAAAIGISKEEIDVFITRLEKVFSEYKKKKPSSQIKS